MQFEEDAEVEWFRKAYDEMISNNELDAALFKAHRVAKTATIQTNGNSEHAMTRILMTLIITKKALANAVIENKKLASALETLAQQQLNEAQK
jgi:hypothetical protein